MRNFLCTFSATTKANTIRDIYLYGNSRNHLLRCGINIPVDEITLNCPSTVQNGCRFEKSHHRDIYSFQRNFIEDTSLVFLFLKSKRAEKVEKEKSKHVPGTKFSFQE
uniref:Uncharacterized protein n=1 Tax=Cacopsylla melanoneura TaxID=428564 RepID=A0A8D8X7P9_9HEMI